MFQRLASEFVLACHLQSLCLEYIMLSCLFIGFYLEYLIKQGLYFQLRYFGVVEYQCPDPDTPSIFRTFGPLGVESPTHSRTLLGQTSFKFLFSDLVHCVYVQSN